MKTPTGIKLLIDFFCFSLQCFVKDIGLLVEGHNGDNDSLSLDVFQVGL